MNKQEAIEEINNLKGLTILDKIINFDSEMISKKEVLNIFKQLDEPERPPEPKPVETEKPVVPKYVADWLEVCKDNLPLSLAHSMNNIIMMSNNQPDKTIHWIAKNSETFAKAWLYGYEIEKEKLYTVEIPNPNGDGYRRVYLGKNEDNKIKLHVWDCFPSIEFSNDWKQLDIAQLTEAEIKEDFAWAFRWAKEV